MKDQPHVQFHDQTKELNVKKPNQLSKLMATPWMFSISPISAVSIQATFRPIEQNIFEVIAN